MKTKTLLLSLCVVVLLASCAAGVNVQIDTFNDQGVIAGFWRGVWHGMIAPITFVVSLFNSGVKMYEVHNNGGWYDLGFLFGLGAVYGGGHASIRARRRAARIQ
jgi:hypothetical protein